MRLKLSDLGCLVLSLGPLHVVKKNKERGICA
jgi:hypothetical protein